LLNNAIKFTPIGGRVTLRLWREQKNAVFQVEDTGIGISEEQRSLLFKKFQQLDMSNQRTYGGIGIGLALSKQLIELHHGWIEVESSVNQGSTFTIWLPEQIPDRPARGEVIVATSEAIAPACPLESRRRCIALVEEDEELADLICNLLTMAGYQVVWLIDSSVVMQQFEILQPVVALLSTRLSGLTAKEVLHHLQMLPAAQAVPVLVLLQAGEPEQPWLAQGAVDSLTGAISQPEQLLIKVAALVEQAQAIPTA
jgi:two-component system sensor histidine kinase/response regulator